MARPPTRPEHDRLIARIERSQDAQFERFAGMVREIDVKVNDLQRSMRMDALESGRVASNVHDLALQVADLRDMVDHRKTEEAHNVATETVEQARPAFVAETRKAVQKLNRPQKLILGAFGLGAFVEFVDKGPKVAKWLIAFVKMMAGQG